MAEAIASRLNTIGISFKVRLPCRSSNRNYVNFAMNHQLIILSLTLNFWGLGNLSPSLALPPPEDTPEEILRTEIILNARSPIDGKYLTASEYAQLQADLQESAFAPQLQPNLQHLIFLLQIRKLFKTLIPLL
jgi:hypothetical protein